MTDSAKMEIILAAKDMSAQTLKSFQTRIQGITKSVFSLKGGIAAMVGVYGFGSLIDKLDKTADAASDFHETFSKVQTLFGAQEADKLRAWGDAAAQAMGLSSKEALDAVGSMGNMFQQLGANNSAAEQYSKSMIQLSADIASFHNVAGGSAAVLDAMQASFRGEYDALQRYIPTISAAKVQEQALADTHKHSAQQLTALEKAVAAQEIIMHDAGSAVGDFARTSGGLANQERILNAQIDNLTRSIGKNLLPVKKEVVSEVNAWIQANNRLIQQRIPQYIDNVATAMEKFFQLAGLRSVTNTFAQAVELSKKGYLDLTKFAKMGFIERQKLVDDILAKQAKINSNFHSIGSQTHGWQSFQDSFKNKPGAIENKSGAMTPPGSSGYTIPEYRQNWSGSEEAMMERARLGKQYESLPVQNSFDYSTATFDIYKNAPSIGGVQDPSQLTRAWTDPMAEANKAALDKMKTVQQSSWQDMLAGGEDFSKRMENAFNGWGASYSNQLTNMLFDSKFTFDNIAESFAKMISEMLIQSAMADFTHLLGNLAGGILSSFMGGGGGGFFGFAKGGAFYGSNLSSYEGMVTDRPHFFKFANGGGVFGEAGWEGILPLKRTSSGKLGVEAVGGDNKVKAVSGDNNSKTEVIINVSAIDANGVKQFFEHNKGLIAGLVGSEAQRDNALRTAIKMASR